jgi:hypothetical protein
MSAGAEMVDLGQGPRRRRSLGAARAPRAARAALACGLALSLLSPKPAEAKRPKARPGGLRVRPEYDPRLPGHAAQFQRAQVFLDEPADLSVIALAPDAIKVSVRVENHALGPAAQAGPFALLLVDGDAALRIDDASRPLLLRGLRPGPHLLRLVLSRPWGEVVKAKGALALSRIWVGPRLEGPAGKAAERAVWPDPKKPLLTCVFPLPEWQEGGPTLETYPEATAAAEAAQAPADPGGQADASVEPPSVTLDAGALPSGEAEAAASKRPAVPQRPVLDFFLSGATLKKRGRGDKLRLVVDKKELPLVREWRPVPLKLKAGEHHLTVDLLDRRGTKVRNAVNRTDRAFTLE